MKLIGENIRCCRTGLSFLACPCEEAVSVPMIDIDERNVDDPMKNPYIGEDWYKTGNNHRVVNGHICRDFIRDTWVVKFNSIEEFENFCLKYARVIVEWNGHNLLLEIYDDYRE